MTASNTFAMLKPDAFELHVVGRVISRIEDEGFEILQMKQVVLTPDRAEAFYAEHAGKSFFEPLINFMISGPVLGMVLWRVSAVARWREILGPADSRKSETLETVRGRHGDRTGLAIWRNVAHGSDSAEAAARETLLFWPKSTPKFVGVGDY